MYKKYVKRKIYFSNHLVQLGQRTRKACTRFKSLVSCILV